MAASIRNVKNILLKNISSCHCTCSVRNFNPRELKKFYKNATISQSDGWFEINLDKKKLKTPNGKVFRVPSEPLALAVATEWNAQDKLVKRHSMHLTSLCNTALDNPTHKTRDDLVRSILHFVETDTLCYRMAEPEDLVNIQKKCWDPILDWARERYGIEIEATTGLVTPDVPQDTYTILKRHLLSYSDWALFGFLFGTENLKSLMTMLALVDKHIDVKNAVELSRLEQEYQIAKWGNVEWYHDLDVEDLKSRVAAAALFIYWSSESTVIMQKATLAV